MLAPARLRAADLTLAEKLGRLHWLFVIAVVAVAAIGYGMLYSAAGGSHGPWAWRQAVRFAMGLAIMLAVALIDIRFWFRWAYVIYALALAGVVAVEVVGAVSMGARRWIDLGFFQVQPSEVMKIALVLALARYFHGGYLDDVGRPAFLIPPALMAVVPAALVLRQPDLGTATMLLAGGGVMFLLAGVRWWKFALVIGTVAAAVPVLWQRLHAYQKQRVLMFLNPEQDPLGAGYHIIQSKIALGSGGLWGKGFLGGTQSQLNFLPEKQTDFIFTMLAEEAGLVGALVLLVLFCLLVGYGVLFALNGRSQFGRLLAMGVTATFFFYAFINIAMVTGLIPVVGVPLPLVSYGGTAMITVLFGFGLLLSVDLHRHVPIARFPAELDR